MEKESEKREKLKEQLLKQYEAGQLKECLPGSLLCHNNNVPKQIPTIEEHRQQASSSIIRRSLAASMSRSNIVTPAVTSLLPPLQLPDVSRPPPGYNFSTSAASIPPVMSSYEPQAKPLPTPVIIPTASYEESLVTKVLQTILSNTAACKPTVAENPGLQTPGPVDKVMNWDTNMDKRQRDQSPHYKSSQGNSRERFKDNRKRSRSRSHDRRRYIKRERSMSRSSRRDYSPRRSRLITPPRHRGYRSPSYPRHYHRHEEYDRHHQPRVLSPLTRKYASPSPRPSHYRKSRSPSRQQGTGCGRYRSRSPLRHSRSPGKRYFVGERSPKSRKIVLLSPHRNKTQESPQRARRESRSSSKTKIRERLGARKQEPLVEVFNMDPDSGRCGQVAIVKEYVDSKSGILELRTTEGGPGDIILFNENQIWMADRTKDPNGPPKLFVEKCKDNCLDLQSLFPVGNEVLLNARKVKSDLVNLQATVIWPKYTEVPKYKLKPSKLDEDLLKFHNDCSRDKLVPICINGLPPVGSLNIWSAKVKDIINEEFGIVEVTCDPRDGKKEFTHKFNCFFHKSDLWLENGVCVGQSQFYQSRSLSELVSLMQPVDLVARSVIREKGQFMKKSLNSTIEMQALCVSLKTSCVPKRAPKGSKIEGGPGAFGGCNRGETPYMFQIGLTEKLNIVLEKFLKVYGKTCVNMDPELIKPSFSSKDSEDSNPAKKVYKITEEETVTRTPPVLAELVSDVQAIIIQPPGANGFGILESCERNWKAIFHIDDGVLFQGVEDLKLGSKICVNAHLMDASLDIQYIASCIWKKSETVLRLPNVLNKKSIKAIKIDQFHQLNMKSNGDGKIGNLPRHLELKTGVIAKIVDDNYGIINQDGLFVLFDICDFWINATKTASEEKLKLGNLVSLGELVCFHGALVNPRSIIPYLATSVWIEESVQGDQAPILISRDKIHPDKIKIYQTVSSSSAITGELMTAKKNEGAAMIKGYLSNVSGVVKFGVHLAEDDIIPAAGMVEIKGCPNIKAFFLAVNCVEAHEKLDVCVPDTQVTFSASPVSTEFAPLTHVVTSISSVHQQVSNHNDKKVIAARTLEVLLKIKLDNSLIDFLRSDPDLLYLGIYKKRSKVVDCVPTGRLVCMIDKNSGILESQDREFAYFELSDTNLPSSLPLKDVVLVMSRCRGVSIRFQATPALSGPVKLMVHDGSIAISSNLDKYHPEIKLKKTSPSLVENSFSQEKLKRAQEAIEKLKCKQILSIDKILKSSRYESILKDPKNAGKTITDEIIENRSKNQEKTPKRTDVEGRCLKNVKARLKSFLNENFALLEFVKEDGTEGFCLFDSFDLHLPGVELKNTTINQHLAIGDTAFFNAYEFCPINTVSWLANAVWKQELATPPEPIPVSKISKDKIVVFEKVAEACSIMMQEDLKDRNKEQSSAVDKSSDFNMNQTPTVPKEDDIIVEPSKEQLLDFEVENLEVAHLKPNNYEAAGLTLDVGNKKVKCLTHYSRVWMKDHPMKATKEEWDLMQKSKRVKVRAFPTKDFKEYKYLAHFVLVKKEKENGGSIENHERSYVNFESSVSDVKAQNNLHEFTQLVQ